jgi:hypothetical protein
MAVVTAIPIIISVYRGWAVTIRRIILGVLCCVFIGIAIGTSRPFSKGHHEAPDQLAQIRIMLQGERVAHVAAEKRADQAEQQAKNDRLALESAEQKARNLESTVGQIETKLDAALKRLAEVGNTPNPTETAPEVPASKAGPSSKTSDAPPPRQKLEYFIVEVPRAQISGDGNATVYVRFTSITTTRIKMLLAGGFLGDGKTFLVDDLGQRYDLDNASGIGSCCFGFAGGDWKGGVLEMPAKGDAEITLTFRRRGHLGEREPERPQALSLTVELTLGDVVRVQGWGQQWRSTATAGISIAGINPR